ncbi:MAG: hypothetical protein HYX69_01255 [Planctomycetia bacterium]|nr:hypothetical protein [Planctomycetia bacterium]
MRRTCVLLSVPAAVALVAAATAQRAVAQDPPPRPEKFPVIADLGDYEHKITTAAPQTQAFFNQGLRLLYAFNHNEALRAFQAIEDVDPHCAMAFWGMAYSLGPNYNLEADPEREKQALAAIQKAQRYARIAAPWEVDYIAALAKRHSDSPETADRKALDRAYADAMRELAKKYPDDLDAAVLYAEALMDLRPWDLWTRDGQPQPGTEEIVATLERVLEKNPNHPGACHFYIHAVEASTRPERALAAADRLPGLAPGAGHLVHMPAHIYMRLGRYNDAAENNRRAVKADRAYIERYKPEGIYPMFYYPHNVHFLWAALCFAGCRAEAVQAADEVSKLLGEEAVREMPMIEAFVPTRLFTSLRFGLWDEVLAAPPPSTELRYATGIWHYARGIALAETAKLDDASGELKQLREIQSATPADTMFMRHSVAHLLSIATGTLAGKIAANEGHSDEAVARLQEAVRLQDDLAYDEPPPWYYSVRQSLGAVLLAAGRAAEAEKVYRADLERYPENGWSLFGLAESLKAQNSVDATNVRERFEKAFAAADHKPRSSEF